MPPNIHACLTLNAKSTLKEIWIDAPPISLSSSPPLGVAHSTKATWATLASFPVSQTQEFSQTRASCCIRNSCSPSSLPRVVSTTHPQMVVSLVLSCPSGPISPPKRGLSWPPDPRWSLHPKTNPLFSLLRAFNSLWNDHVHLLACFTIVYPLPWGQERHVLHPYIPRTW